MRSLRTLGRQLLVILAAFLVGTVAVSTSGIAQAVSNDASQPGVLAEADELDAAGAVAHLPLSDPLPDHLTTLVTLASEAATIQAEAGVGDPCHKCPQNNWQKVGGGVLYSEYYTWSKSKAEDLKEAADMTSIVAAILGTIPAGQPVVAAAAALTASFVAILGWLVSHCLNDKHPPQIEVQVYEDLQTGLVNTSPAGYCVTG